MTSGATPCMLLCSARERARHRGIFLSFAASPDPLPSLAQLTFPSNGLVNHQPIAAARSRTSSQLDLANWLLAKESTSEVDAPGLSAAAKRVCQKLLLRLSRLVSPAGSQAILSRRCTWRAASSGFLKGSAPAKELKPTWR